MITYDDVQTGDQIFAPIPGVHWKRTLACIMHKQPPNAIAIREIGGRNLIYVVSKEWFDNAGFESVTDELMAKEPSK